MGNGYGKSKRGNGHSTWTWTKHYPKRLPTLAPPLSRSLSRLELDLVRAQGQVVYGQLHLILDIIDNPHATPWPETILATFERFFLCLFLFPALSLCFFTVFSVFFSSVFRFLCDDLWICMNCADEVLCKVHAAIEFIWFGIYCCCPSLVLHCRYTFWRLPPRCASLNWVRAGWSSITEEFCKLDEDVWLVCAAEVEGNTIYSCWYI